MTTPERRRARSMPRRRPEATIERAEARRWGGARSPTRGSTGDVVLVSTGEKGVGLDEPTQLRRDRRQGGEEGEEAEYWKRACQT